MWKILTTPINLNFLLKRIRNLLKKIRNLLKPVIVEIPIGLTQETVAEDIANILAHSKLLIQARRKIRLYCRINNIELK